MFRDVTATRMATDDELWAGGTLRRAQKASALIYHFMLTNCTLSTYHCESNAGDTISPGLLVGRVDSTL